jgi:hypothetical protein
VKKMTELKKMAEGLIEPFLKNYSQILYPKVNNFKVGAIRSRGGGVAIQSDWHLSSRFPKGSGEQETPQ